MPDPKDTFNDWVKMYLNDLVAWALQRLNDKDLARDLVQETFVSAWQQMDRFEGKSSPKTWLIGILKFKVADHYRLAYTRPTTSFSTHPWFNQNEEWKTEERPGDWAMEDQAELLDQPGFRAVWESCLGKLSGIWHTAICSRYLDEKDASAICQELSITPTNYWQMLHRAKLQLRKCLEMNYFNT